MQASDIPSKFGIPFANGAGGAFIRPIPTASQIGVQNGAASLTDGFPPNTFAPIAAGGSWPWGADFNGILKQITQWSRWFSAGGPILYDSAFQTSIGGYPRGTLVASPATIGLFWLSLVENNVTNPDTGGAGWQPFPLPPGAAAANLGPAGGDLVGTYPNPTFNQGLTHAWSVVQRFVGGVIGSAANFFINNNANTANNLILSDGGALSIRASIAAGGNVSGDTVTATNYIAAGTFLQAATSVSALNGNVLAQNGRLRASFGASGGDSNTAPIIADFTIGANAYGFYAKFPGGFIIQGGLITTTTGTGDAFNFPTAFPNSCVAMTGTDDGSGIRGIGIKPGAYGSPIGYFVVYGGILDANGVTPLAGIGVNWMAIGY